MKPSDFRLTPDKPKIEIKKPANGKFWQKPSFNFWLYVLFLIVSLYFFQSYTAEQREEIPYSQFLQYVDKGEVANAVVTDKLITGTLTETDPKTKQPRRFVTVPLWDDQLAQRLQKHDVKYSVEASSNWLSSFLLNWVLPFGVLFLLWSWMARRTLALFNAR